jgi:hypothetical protein
MKSVGNPAELFTSMYRWCDQLIALGKRVEGQLVENGLNEGPQNCFAGSILSVSLMRDA